MSSVTKNFVLAGRAVFTLEVPEPFRVANKRKGVEVKPHYTYRVNYKPAEGNFKEAYFLQLLTGPDNTKSYSYLGMLDKQTGAVRWTTKSCRPDNDMSIQLVRRLLARVWAGESAAIEQTGFKLHHEGRCGRCGRALTTPESVERGIGPECWEVMGGPTIEEEKIVRPIIEAEKAAESRQRRIEDTIERMLAESERLENLQTQPGNFGEETDPYEDYEPDPTTEAEDRALRQAHLDSLDWGPYRDGY